jgi:hypothetical protein
MGALLSLMVVLYFGGWTFINNYWLLKFTHTINNFINFYIINKINFDNRITFDFSVYFTETLISIIKLLILTCLLILFRAAFPRINLVNLPRFFWKYLIPFSIGYLWYLVTFFLNINPAFILFQKKNLTQATNIEVLESQEFNLNKNYESERLLEILSKYDINYIDPYINYEIILQRENLSKQEFELLNNYIKVYKLWS